MIMIVMVMMVMVDPMGFSNTSSDLTTVGFHQISAY
jgi:hypothetical protein